MKKHNRGSSNDVSVLQVNKFADFRIAYDTMNRIETRLQLAFLLNSSIQRNAERVTASEIRFMAEDLEQSFRFYIQYYLKNFNCHM